MTDELSRQARALLERALAEERVVAPDTARRARVKRGLLGAATLAAAGRAAAAPIAQVAAQGAALPGALGAAPWVTFTKAIAVGVLVSAGLIGGLRQFTSPPATSTSRVASAQNSAPPRLTSTPSATPRAEPSVSVSAAVPAGAASAPMRVSGSPPAPPVPPSEPAPGLGAELQLMTAAQAALRDGRAAEALALLARYDRAFPSGQLLNERLAAEVLAACQLGDRARAQRAADRFLQRDASSPLAARVRRSCVAVQTRAEP